MAEPMRGNGAMQRLARMVCRWLLSAVAGAVVTTSGRRTRSRPRAVKFVVVGDTIPAPLEGARGDAGRGRALIVARDAANCVLCHAIPDPAVRFLGQCRAVARWRCDDD